MKKTLIYLSAALLALVACNKEASVKEAAPTRTMIFKCIIATENPDGSKVAIADNGKTTWEAGDEVLFHGKWAGGQYSSTVELAAENISDDGKEATFVVPEFNQGNKQWGNSTIIAVYPASAAAVDNGNSNWYSSNVYNTSNAPLMCGFNDITVGEGTVFKFFNLTGIIAFSVSGEFDNYVFSGNNDEIVGYDGYKTDQYAKTDGTDYISFTAGGTGLTKISGGVEPDGSTLNYVCIANGAKFTKGFTLLFRDGIDGPIISEAKNINPIEIPRNGYLNLGDITDHLKDYVPPTVDDHQSEIPTEDAVDLSADGPANCYVLSAPGIYKLPAVKGNNSDMSAGSVYGVELLWETCCTADAVTKNSVLAAVDYEDNWIYLQTPGTLKPGNALVAAKNASGDIIWSWHIWIPETMFTTSTFGYTSNCEIMSRNLGALVDTQAGAVALPESFGLLYQWGRKDPFLGANAAGATESVAFAGTAMTVHDGQMSQEEAAAAPTTLVNVGEDTDWCTVTDKLYWGDQEKSAAKSIYDPCPPGYRAAGRKRATIFTADGSTLPNWLYDKDNYYIQVGEPVSTLPICGYLNPDGSYSTGKSIVWNTHMDADTDDISYCQYIYYDSALEPPAGVSKKSGKERAKACSVRCETEE